MADIRWQIEIMQADGTAFSTANEAGAAVRLRSSTSAAADSGEYVGNDATSGAFSPVGSGFWYIGIDSADSGYFLVQSYTTATGTWTNVSGFAPIQINLEEMLQLSGGTMTGSINMGDNSVTNLNTITFNAGTGTIAGIQNQNLVDKSAAETLSGNNTFSGNCTFSGTNTVTGATNFTADKLKINSIIMQPYIYITHSFGTYGRETEDVNSVIFISDDAWVVVGAQCITGTAETTGNSYIQLERLSGVEVADAGDDILTNNANLGFNVRATAGTVQTGTLNSSYVTLADGDRLGLVLSAAATQLTGFNITIKLKRV